MQVTFRSRENDFENALGVYQALPDGTPTFGTVLWPNVKAVTPGRRGSAVLPARAEEQAVGLFLVVNHGRQGGPRLSTGGLVSFHRDAELRTRTLSEGGPLRGATVFSDPDLNALGVRQVSTPEAGCCFEARSADTEGVRNVSMMPFTAEALSGGDSAVS